MKRSEATNTFQEGLVMDLNPLVTPNSVLTNCLNGTLITYQGNENVLQNDMGNGRVETAYLPEGYIPLGTCSLGGIIYIVSYNPFTKKGQIGSFPSPERNITSDELGSTNIVIRKSDFLDNNGQPYVKNIIKTYTLSGETDESKLYPGDLYKVYTTDSLPNDTLSAMHPNLDINANVDNIPRYLKLYIATIHDNGSIEYLSDYLAWGKLSSNNKYYFISELQEHNGTVDLDQYRTLVSSGYNIYNSKFSGKLVVIAKLEVIDSFSAGWDCIKNGNEFQFGFSVNWTYENDLEKSKSRVNIDSIDITSKYSNKVAIRCSNLKEQLGDGGNDQYNQVKPLNYYKYMESGENIAIQNLPRKNDGSDADMWIRMSSFTPESDDEILEVTITPCQYLDDDSYKLNHLAKHFSIELSKIGKKDFTLKQWRYYVNGQVLTLNWGLDAYCEPYHLIKDIQFRFYKLNNDIYNKYISNSELGNYDSEITISGKSSYSGNFTNTFLLEDFGKLEKNQCYICSIWADYVPTEGNNTNYEFIANRVLYTSEIFNQAYLTKDDFDTLNLQDYLSIQQTVIQTKSELDNLTTDTVSKIENEGSENKKEIFTTTLNYSGNTEKECKLENSVSQDLFKINIQEISLGSAISNYSPNNPSQIYTKSKETLSDISYTSNSSTLNKTSNENIFNIKYSYNDQLNIQSITNQFKNQSIEYSLILQKLRVGYIYLSADLEKTKQNFRYGSSANDFSYKSDFKITSDDKSNLFRIFSNFGDSNQILNEFFSQYDVVNIIIYIDNTAGSDMPNGWNTTAKSDPAGKYNWGRLIRISSDNTWQLFGPSGPRDYVSLDPINSISNPNKIYKLIKCDGEYEIIKIASNINYYSDFKYSNNVIIPSTINYKLCIGDATEINPNSTIPNFKYTGQFETQINLEYSNIVNTYKPHPVIENLIGVINDDDTISSIDLEEIRTNKLYKSSNDKYSIASSSNFRINNQMLVCNKNAPSSINDSSIPHFKFGQDDQSLTINAIDESIIINQLLT